MSEEKMSRYEICIERVSKIFDLERAKKICRKYYNPISDEELQKIREYALSIMRSDPEKYHVQYELPSGLKVDVIFVLTPSAPKIKKTQSGNYKVGVLMPSPGPNTWVSAFLFNKEDAELLASNPDSPFLLVGKLRTSDREGTTYYNINVWNVIPLFTEENLEVPLDEEEPAEEGGEEYGYGGEEEEYGYGGGA